jgi:hypothetical protein
MEKSNPLIQTLRNKPLILSALSALLFILTWNIPSFPIFIFVAFIPLFILLDLHGSNPKIERMVFGVLTLGVILSRPFTFQSLIGTILFGVFISLAFKGFQFSHSVFPKAKKIMLIIGILAIEYGMLKFHYPKDPVFVADALQSVDRWTRWNVYTGYLGASFWILIMNLFLYKGIFEKPSWHWPSIGIAIITLSIPCYISYVMDTGSIMRSDMEQLYHSNGYLLNNAYIQHGEVIGRTGAWVSVLMIIFILVRVRTKK